MDEQRWPTPPTHGPFEPHRYIYTGSSVIELSNGTIVNVAQFPEPVTVQNKHVVPQRERLVREYLSQRIKRASYGPKEVLPPNWSDWACNQLAAEIADKVERIAYTPPEIEKKDSYVAIWEVDGDIRLRFPGTFHQCWRVVKLLNDIPGPGSLYIQGGEHERA